MANSKISGLPLATTPLAGTEVLPIVQGGATKQVSVGNLTAGRAVSATEFIGPLTDSTYRRIYNPNGGTYIRTGVTDTGAIRVKLPVGVNAEFVNITLKVIENDSPNLTFEAHFGGYVAGPWIGNCFAYIVGSPNTNRQFTVRFGWDGGSRLFVYIGELSSSWVNAAISITEVQTGFGTASSIWTSGWEIDFVSSAFQNVTDTITAPQVGYLVASGNTAQGSVQYSGTTSTAGTFDGGTTTPTATNRLNYSGNFYPTALNLVGTGDTATAATHYIVETGSDGFLRPKTLANTQAEIVTNASVSAAISSGLSTLTVTGSAFLSTTSGDVGIGTTSPAQKLDVQGATNPTIKVRNITPGVGNYSQLYLDTNNTFSGAGAAYLRAISENAGNSAVSLALGVNANGGGAPSEAMRITAAGDVGINTSSPLSKLTVSAANTASGSEQLNITDTTTNNRLRLGYNTATNLGVIEALTAGVAYRDIVINPNGGNLGLGVTPSAWVSNAKALQIGVFPALWQGSNGATQIGFGVYEGGINTYNYSTTGDLPTMYRQLTGAHAWYTAGAGTAGNAISFTQAMTLDASGNLGVGTSSPAAKFEVANTSGSVAAILRSSNSGYSELYFADVADNAASAISYEHATNILRLYNGGSARVYLDSAGNLGLGVTPSAWVNYRALQVGALANLSYNAGFSIFGSNAFFNGTNWIYQATNRALDYYQDVGNGNHVWRIAASGTAGNAISFTQAMTLDASGDFIVGGTTATNTAAGRGNITINGSSSAILSIGTGGSEKGYVYTQGSDFIVNATTGNLSLQTQTASPIAFLTNNTERMRIDSSGNVGVGTSSPAANLDVRGASGGILGQFLENSSGNSRRIRFSISSNVSNIESTSSTGTTNLAFAVDGTERMRIDASGNVGIGTTGPSVKLQVNGTSNGATLELLRLSNIGTGANTKSRLNFYAASTNYGSITGGYGASVPEMVFDINTTAGAYIWNNNATEQMRLDTSGNLGLGVTPSAWWGGVKAIDVGSYASIMSYASGFGTSQPYVRVSSNAYLNGSLANIYKTSNPAASYEQSSGAHIWLTASSGTAGNTISFTQAMTLDASGNLLVGKTATSGDGKLQVIGGNAYDGNFYTVASFKDVDSSAEKGVLLGYNNASNTGIISAAYGNGSQSLAFWTHNNTAWGERARIPAAGGMVVGIAALATTATDGFLYVPTCAGTPTGTPTTQTGTAPIVIDTTNNKLYFYSGGQWRDAGP